MAKITKACKGVSYPKSSSVSKRLGSPGTKMKKGGSFPDLNKDGKITQKDILIGKGVLPKTAKKGMKVKKAQDGKEVGDYFWETGKYKNVGVGSKGPMTNIKKSSDKNYRKKTTYLGIDNDGGSTRNVTERRTLKGFLTGAPKAGGKFVEKDYKKGGTMKKSMKTGGKMTKKCMYGCK